MARKPDDDLRIAEAAARAVDTMDHLVGSIERTLAELPPSTSKWIVSDFTATRDRLADASLALRRELDRPQPDTAYVRLVASAGRRAAKLAAAVGLAVSSGVASAATQEVVASSHAVTESVDELERQSQLNDDDKPNQSVDLMSLEPAEFQSLIETLVLAMGLEVELTSDNSDSGFDLLAIDRRPLFGNKTVVQIRKTARNVSEQDVRRAYGAMKAEDANMAIMMTTSSFSAKAVSFADEKPIELVPGRMLIFLLEEHLGIHATIGSASAQ